jgi:hypothetical protein
VAALKFNFLTKCLRKFYLRNLLYFYQKNKNMKKLLLLTLGLSFCFSAFGQQLPELIYYKFDSGPTIINDASSPVGNNPASITGTGLSVGGLGLFSTALVGTGTSSTAGVINTGWPTSINGSFTIGFWTSNITPSGTLWYIFGDNTASAFRCFTNGVAGANNWLMRFTGGLPDIIANNAATTAPTYTHFVYDAAAGQMRSYVNGVLNQTVTAPTTFSVSGTGFQVGGYNTNSNLSGNMDEFRFYNRALTAAEILTTISGPINPAPCTGATVTAAVATPAQICLGGTTNLSATNFSFGLGTSYQWQSSPDDAVWTNMLNDTMPGVSVSPLDTTYYRLVVTCGAQSATSTSVRVDVLGTPLPGGTYTINSLGATGGTNFANFTDFFQSIECGGISGPIVVNVVSGTGPYVEHVRAGNIGNTSAINSIIINGNGEVLEFSNTDNLQRATLTLDGSSFITIDGLVIRALATGSVGYGIHLTNGANNNVIKNCQIEIPQTTTSANFAGIVGNTGTTAIAQGANFPFENTIENNIITGGYYGITLIGGGSAIRANGNKVINNTIHEYYFYGIYSHSQEDFEYIGNDMARPSRATLSSFYGIFCTQEHHGGTIAKNAIHDPFGQVSSTSLIYAMYSTNASGTANKPNHVYNNIFYKLENNGTLYGIWNATSSHWKYYHNSIDIDDLNPTAGLTRAIYLSGNSDNVEFLNNVISLNRSGTSLKYAVYILGSGTRTFDNNGYFVNYTSGNTEFGYLNTGQATFSDWQTATSWDGNSIFVDPNFLFAPGGVLVPNAGALDNIGQNLTAIVPTDYYDSVRTITPDPGAFEFVGPPCSNPVGFDTMAITSTSIQLVWNQPGAVTEWDIEWGPVGFTPGTTGGNRITTTNNPYTITQLTPGDCYDVYIRANCTNLNLGVGMWVGPVTTCLPWTFDLAIDEMVSPNSPTGCGAPAMPVTAVIYNNGETPISGIQLNASVTGAFTATINTTYAGPLASGASDTVVIGTINSSAGGYIDVLIYHAWAQDQNSVNDSLAVDSILILPELPQQLPSFACANNDSVTISMQPFPGASYLWYDQATGGNLVNTGNDFRVPTTAPGPYYVEYQSGLKDSLFLLDQGGSGCGAGNMFDLVPQRVLSITGFDLRPFGTDAAMPVTVFMVNASHTTLTGGPAGWTQVAQGTINATANVLTRFDFANPVMLQPNQTYGFYVQFNASYTVGANTYSNNDLEFISGNGACSPFDYCCTPRTFNGAIHYEISGCVSQREVVQATVYQDTAVADFTFTQTGPGDFSFDATNSTGHQFDWDFGDLNTAMGISTSHSYVTSGSYNVTLIVTDTVCNTTDSMAVTVTSTVSLEEFLIEQSLRVFPNPSRDVFHIEFEMEGTRDMYLRVLSPTGQLIMQEHTGRTGGIYKKTINLGTMAKGVYILQVQTENGIVSRKLTLM